MVVGSGLPSDPAIPEPASGYKLVRGFLLNNQLTDFSFQPSDAAGPIANRVGPLKRPRSSMSPTLVFAKAADGSIGNFVMGTGSPGGASIIQFVSKTLIGVLDGGMDAQQATSMINFGASNSVTTGIGGEHPNVVAAISGAGDSLVTRLRAVGHTVSVAAQCQRHQHHRQDPQCQGRPDLCWRRLDLSPPPPAAPLRSRPLHAGPTRAGPASGPGTTLASPAGSAPARSAPGRRPGRGLG